jgi:hypothetical protein
MRQKSELLRQVWRLVKAFSILKKPINTIALGVLFYLWNNKCKKSYFCEDCSIFELNLYPLRVGVLQMNLASASDAFSRRIHMRSAK